MQRTSPYKQGGTIRNQNNPSVISQLPLENNRSQIYTQTIAPRKGHQQDRYEGPVDPNTRRRHGKGVYHYTNKYFTYQGNYEQGVKQGEGQLLLGDGTVIKGTFSNNQLTGPAEISYADGSTYKGQLYLGQKCGKGQYKSQFQTYTGEYKDNKKHGEGTLKTRTLTISGVFHNNKPHGENVKVSKYNYQYEGGYEQGKKSGKGREESSFYEQKYTYEGSFTKDLFDGEGKYVDESDGRVKDQAYCYEGQFKEGIPKLYPNEFRVSFASATAGTLPEGEEKPQQFVNITSTEGPIEYEVQSQMQLFFLIESCYQGPEELDPNQPSQEQIDKMIKDWQATNKKNKNPPPMPDFTQPKMIKPEVIVVEQQLSRPIQIKIAKDNQQEGQQPKEPQYIKVDYRQLLSQKRAQNQETKAENAKKAEQQGAKKGGKGNPKAGELQLKLNCYVENPTSADQSLPLSSAKGKLQINKLEFPDDLPQANYQLIIQSPFSSLGGIKPWRKQLCVKPKNAGGKKK